MLTFTQTSALIKAIQAAFEFEIGTKLEGALCCALLMKGCSCVSNEWWMPLLSLIEAPCSVNPPRIPKIDNKVLSDLSTQAAGNRRSCLPLDLLEFKATTREGQDIVIELLNNKRVLRWVRGDLAHTAKQLRLHCMLNVIVQSRNRRGLTKAEMKVTEDLIQLASFARFFEDSAKAVKDRRDASVKKILERLSNKLKIAACDLREAVQETLIVPYVTSDDIPADLRHHKMKNTKGRIETYVIAELAEEFLRILSSFYERNKRVKLCES